MSFSFSLPPLSQLLDPTGKRDLFPQEPVLRVSLTDPQGPFSPTDFGGSRYQWIEPPENFATDSPEKIPVLLPRKLRVQPALAFRRRGITQKPNRLRRHSHPTLSKREGRIYQKKSTANRLRKQLEL